MQRLNEIMTNEIMNAFCLSVVVRRLNEIMTNEILIDTSDEI